MLGRTELSGKIKTLKKVRANTQSRTYRLRMPEKGSKKNPVFVGNHLRVCVYVFTFRVRVR